MMDAFWPDLVWRQFGAAIEMLENTIEACPESLWRARLWDSGEGSESSEFWSIAYHTLFYLDFYLSGKEEGFSRPAPFTPDRFDSSGRVPKQPFSKQDLHAYLSHGRAKCEAVLLGLTDELAQRPSGFHWLKMSFAELILYTLRHVQEHAGQLGLFLGQHHVTVDDWVSQGKEASGAG